MILTKHIVMETKKGSTGTKLLDQGLKLLSIYLVIYLFIKIYFVLTKFILQ